MSADDFDEALARATNELSGGLKFLARREINELPALLMEGELPERLVYGSYNNRSGLLVGTNRRVLFIDKGMVSLKVEDFSYDKITSVQYDLGTLMGSVTIFASGNKAEIKNVDKKHARGFGEWLQNRIAVQESIKAGAASSSSGPAAPTIDPLERLKRAAELRDAGVLTEEEFQKQKTLILG